MRNQSICLLVAACLLTACASSTPRSPTGPSPLAIANCPPLTPLADDSLGAVVAKLVEVSGQYYRCREAALADPQIERK